MLLPIRAVAHPANVYRPLGDWLIETHPRKDVALDGAVAFGVFFPFYAPAGSLHAPFAVAFVPYIELGAVAERVNVYFCHNHSNFFLL